MNIRTPIPTYFIDRNYRTFPTRDIRGNKRTLISTAPYDLLFNCLFRPGTPMGIQFHTTRRNALRTYRRDTINVNRLTRRIRNRPLRGIHLNTNRNLDVRVPNPVLFCHLTKRDSNVQTTRVRLHFRGTQCVLPILHFGLSRGNLRPFGDDRDIVVRGTLATRATSLISSVYFNARMRPSRPFRFPIEKYANGNKRELPPRGKRGGDTKLSSSTYAIGLGTKRYFLSHFRRDDNLFRRTIFLRGLGTFLHGTGIGSFSTSDKTSQHERGGPCGVTFFYRTTRSIRPMPRKSVGGVH